MIEHDGCVGCRYEMCSPYSEECRNCTQMTIYDKIRRMDDKELDKFLNLLDMKNVIKN